MAASRRARIVHTGRARRVIASSPEGVDARAENLDLLFDCADLETHAQRADGLAAGREAVPHVDRAPAQRSLNSITAPDCDLMRFITASNFVTGDPMTGFGTAPTMTGRSGSPSMKLTCTSVFGRSGKCIP